MQITRKEGNEDTPRQCEKAERVPLGDTVSLEGRITNEARVES